MTRSKRTALLGTGLVLGIIVLPTAADAGGSWSGLYLGAHGGYGWSDVSGAYDNTDGGGNPTPLNGLDLEGGIYGVHGGYNHQTGGLVLGIEADISGADIEDDILGNEPAPDPIDADLDHLGSIRGRIGFVSNSLPNALFYATAGYGFGEYSISALNVANGTSGSLSLDADGAVYGAGVEFGRPQGRLTVRFEYLHYDLGESSSLNISPFNNNTDVDPGDFVEFDDVDVIRVGLSWKLGQWKQPAPVPYK